MAILLLATLALALWQHRSQRRRGGETERPLLRTQGVSQRPASQRPTSECPAAELLGIVRRLSAESRMWPEWHLLWPLRMTMALDPASRVGARFL